VKNVIEVKQEWYGDQVSKAIIDALFDGVLDSLPPILSDAKSKCPVDTGKLKRSGKILEAKRDGDEIYGRVIFDVDYAVFAEFRKPFLRPALHKNETILLKNFEDKLD